MNRREALKVSLAAAFCFAPEDSERWITVAGPAVNKAGRRYSVEALLKMHAGLSGAKVFAQPSYEQYPELSDLIGMVSESRYSGGLVEVKIRWFDGKKPTDLSHACPWGNATMKDGIVQGDYEFENLAVSPLGSYFHEATPV